MIKYGLVLIFLFFGHEASATTKLPTSLFIAAPEIPPLVYYNDQKKLVGTLVDTLNAFTKKTNINVTIDVMTWARALEQVKHHKHDALMPTLKTAEREQYLTFPELALINFKSSVLIQRKSSQSAYDSLESLVKGKIIAKARSMLLGNELDAIITSDKLEVVEVNLVESAIQMLALGRVDFVATDKGIALSVIKKLSLSDQFVFIPVGDKSSDSYLAFSQEFSAKYDVENLMKAILSTNDSPILNSHQ